MNTDKSLFKLDELDDYVVADGYVDVRGYEVKDKDGRVVGEVENLIVNKNTERVVYLDVEVDESIISQGFKPYANKASDMTHTFLNEDGDTHLIIPIGLANIDEETNCVTTDKVDYNTFATTKRYQKDHPIYRNYEVNVMESYVGRNGNYTPAEGDAFYSSPEFSRLEETETAY